LQSLLLDDGLERMKKNGPQDVCYCVSYDSKDSQFMQKLDRDLLFQKLEEKWNDHHSLPEFIQVSKADDVVTYPGLSYCMQQILGSITTRWRYMCAGSGTQQARPYQQGLEAEVFPRADMTVPAQGSATRSNQALRFVGIFPASFPTITVRESAVTQAVSGTSVYLNRNLFTSNPITHTVSVLPFTIASLITFSSVTTWS
jgi:hypothetical protein